MNKTLSSFIKDTIKKQEISGNALAKNCKVSQSYISRLINEKSKPTVEFLKKLAPHLGVDYKFLMTLTGDLESPIPQEGIEFKQADKIPLLGNCPASPKRWELDDVEGWYPVLKKDIRGRRLYLLRVVGDSMNKAGIDDGDYILIDADKLPENGNIAVVKVDGECTLKRFYRTRQNVMLVPDSTNPEHQAMTFGPKEEIQLRGVVEAIYMKKVK
jgi:repressor LexA